MSFGTEGEEVNNWRVMAPCAEVGFKPSPNSKVFEQELAKLPGVKSKGAGWRVPGNAIKVVAKMCERYDVPLSFAKWQTPPSTPISWEAARGHLVVGGEVRSWVLDGFLTPYQEEAIAFGWNKTGVHFWHSTGAGKTLTGVLSSLSSPGPVIIITRASARLQFAREIERFTFLRPYVIRPEGEKRGLMTVQGQTWVEFFKARMPELGKAALVAEEWKAAKAEHGVTVKKGSSLLSYLKGCVRENRRPVIVVGWEALTSHLPRLKTVGATTVVYDELHQGKGNKRWEVVPVAHPEGPMEKMAQAYLEQERDAKKQGGFIKEDEDGRKMFLPVMNRAAAAADLARTVHRRIGTTATPIKDRVRDLWSQLDIVEPNAHGSKTVWETRHADRKPGIYGGYDTTGSSNLDELNMRLEGVAHILSYSETHKHLPPKRRQSIYLAPEDQCRPTGGFSKERKDAAKRGASAVLEVGLAEAASRKRPAVVGLVEDHVGSKQKVVLFTGRRRDCDALGKSVRSSQGVKKSGAKVWVAHGEQSQILRDQIVQDYMAHPGPCVLVGTGHAFGESLNIDDTDAAFFVMLPYTPGQLRQWEGRFHRASTTKPVIIYYVIAEGTVDEHMAAILIDKLPAVEKVVADTELGEAKNVLAGFDENETEEEFASSVLADLDFG
jgi:superfamily II DNA or RNA helicase